MLENVPHLLWIFVIVKQMKSCEFFFSFFFIFFERIRPLKIHKSYPLIIIFQLWQKKREPDISEIDFVLKKSSIRKNVIYQSDFGCLALYVFHHNAKCYYSLWRVCVCAFLSFFLSQKGPSSTFGTHIETN